MRDRIHELATQTKQGLRQMDDVTLYTPMAPELSAGIVCFDKSDLQPRSTIARLLEHQIIGSTTPYRPSYARLTPGLCNSHKEIEDTLAAIRAI